MKHKKIMILLAVTIVLLSISSVCATGDDSQIGLTQDNIITDDLKSGVEDIPLTQIDNDEIVTVENTPEALSADEGNYSDLRDEIGEGGDVNLTKSYYRYTLGDGDSIIITNPGVIDGKGAVIDMAGLYTQALVVNTTNVTIKNLTIKNVNWFDEGGAIFFFNGTGTVINCNFTNNTAAKGGAIQFYDGVGIVTNCIFTNNIAAGNDGGEGGEGAAIRTLYASALNIENCVFINNTAIPGDPEASPLLWTSTGAAIDTAADLVITNSKFNNNSAYYGGAVFLTWGNVVISNSNFTNNSAVGGGGGAIENLNSDVTIESSTFDGNNVTDGAGAIYNDCDGKLIIRNCIFTDNVGDKACAVFNELMGECVGDLSIENSTFANNGGADKHSIYNEGTLALAGNNVDNIIYNKAKITSKTNVTVSTNKNTNIKYGESITLKATFTDDNGNLIEDKNLKFSVVGVANNIKSRYAGGLYTATYKVNTVGKKVVSAVLGYNATVKTATISVKKATPKLTANAKTLKLKDKTKKYTVTLKTNQNKVMKNTKVTIKVNKKTYTAKTNSKGVATFKLTKITKKGKYTATVSYAGSKYYNAKSVKAKITVK